MNSPEIVNAVLDTAELCIEGHGIFTCLLSFDFGGFHQGMGAYGLCHFDKQQDRRVGTAYGCDFIMRVMRVLEVERWADVKGQHVRVRRENGMVKTFGHFMKDQWFDPTEGAPSGR